MKLNRRIVSDAANISMTNLVIAGTQLAETIILARMLLPEQVGLVAVIAVIVGFVRSFADLGVSNALIHFQNTSRTTFASLYWLLIVFGVVIFSLFIGCRPLIFHYWPGSQLAGLFGWIGLNFLILPFGILYQFLLQKEMRFRRIAVAEGTARCLGTLSLFLLAIGHHGVFSYVGGQIIYTSAKSALLIIAAYRLMPLSFSFDFSAIRPYLRFGIFQMGERTVTFFAANIDYMVIGKFLGTRELGFYKIAYELVTVPQRLINPIFNTLAIPRFAKKQDDDAALREGVLSMLRVLTLITFPLLFGLAASAKVFIPVVYGPGWGRTVPLLWLLTVMGLSKTLGSVGGSVIVAKGHVRTGFIWNCIIAAGNGAVFCIVARYGTGTVAAVYSAVSLVYLLLSFRSYYTVTVGLGMREWVGSFTLSGILSVLMGAAVYGVYLSTGRMHIWPIFELSALVLSGVAIYALLNIFLAREELTGLWNDVRGKQK
ncbi:MAG: MOP flippase family protein [Chitinispirillaceae bacterium]|jgi:O-antigen/teichoic acid export membrane protein